MKPFSAIASCRQWLALRSVSQKPRSPFLRDTSGATAIEFAMLALPFFAFLYALLGIGYIYITSNTLEDATQMAGRQIRIGEVDASHMTKEQFRSMICDSVLVPTQTCLADIVVDVTSDRDISNLDTKAPVTNGVLDPTKEQYNPGIGGDYVIVKAYLPMSSVNSLFALLDAANGPQFVISAVMVFRSEPYS
nr:TadE/TadG family type IV pilus assembly protein [uncultured Cohaesibacter sp.]